MRKLPLLMTLFAGLMILNNPILAQKKAKISKNKQAAINSVDSREQELIELSDKIMSIGDQQRNAAGCASVCTK